MGCPFVVIGDISNAHQDDAHLLRGFSLNS